MHLSYMGRDESGLPNDTSSSGTDSARRAMTSLLFSHMYHYSELQSSNMFASGARSAATLPQI